jgi:cbb3-type cytochrome oxidase cytochrome c subunit
MVSFLRSILCILAVMLLVSTVVAISGCNGGAKKTEAGSELAVLTRPPTLQDAPMVYEKAGCVKCHGAMTTGGGTAPSLARVGATRDVGWLAAYIRDPKSMNPNATMPAFGDTTKIAYGYIQALASALAKQGKPTNPRAPVR